MKKFMSAFLILAIVCALLPQILLPASAKGFDCIGDADCPSAKFDDVKPTAWYHEAVDYAVTNKLFGGMSDTTFEPETAMTRAMLVTVLWRFEGELAGGSANFTDVKSNAWYAKAVAWASKNDIVNGVGNGKFAPEDKVTREQLALILYRYSMKNGIGTGGSGNLSAFSDNKKISSWAVKAYSWAVANGLIAGMGGLLVPQGNATRAQVATILMRFIETKSTFPQQEYRVALITDYGNVDDESFNEAVYMAGAEWCKQNNIDFTYYKPSDDLTEARVEAIDQAVAEGYNVLLLPGYVFADAIVKTAPFYPDVYFIALDVSEFDLQDAAGCAEDYSYVYPQNVFSALYQEEIGGFMAGYAAVKLGYDKLGFLGGMPVPAVVRYGYGFIQGVNQASAELGIKTEVRYIYGNVFFGTENITMAMEKWYASGTQVVFACGGGIFTSAAEAAQKYHGKVIGVDVDQAAFIDAYAEKGMTVTSAMKGLGATVKYMLDELILKNNWNAHGGKVETLGLISANDPSVNFIQLPDSTQWNAHFTKESYKELVSKLFYGTYTVSDNIDGFPAVTNVKIIDEGTMDPFSW